MEDKEEVVEGQAQAPETVETPDTSPETESPAEATAEVDKDLSEWAQNKGYSEEELQNPATLKAVKMAHNAEKFVGKQPQQEPAADDLDRLLDEILGENHTEADVQKTQEVLAEIDPQKMTPEERALLKHLEDKAEAKARAIIAPYEADLRKKQMKGEFDGLVKEYGEDVVKHGPQILAKVKAGVPLREATESVLLTGMLKKASSAGVEKGKQIAKQEISQQVEQTKKADTKLSQAEFDKLSASEQYEIFKAAGLVK